MRCVFARSPLSTVAVGLTFALAACSESPMAPAVADGPAFNVTYTPNQASATSIGIASGSATGYCGSAFGIFSPTSTTAYGTSGTTNDLTGVLASYNPGWPSNPIPGASWIGPYRNSNDYLDARPGTYCFSESFTVPAGATNRSISLTMRADNYALVYLNGVKIGEHASKNDDSFNWQNDLNIGPVSVNAGANVLTVQLVNTKMGGQFANNYTTDNCALGPQPDSKYAPGKPDNTAWSITECWNPTAVIYKGTVSFTPAPVIIVGNQGCSLGYWKNKGSNAFIRSTKVNTIFTFPGSPASVVTKGNQTLQQALENGGGGINALMRQAAAAYMNSLNVQYPLSTAAVVLQVNAALASANYNTLSNTLDRFNNLHNAPICPN